MTINQPNDATVRAMQGAAPLAARRRLNPLEAGAATAVIVSCLVALAMMTGVLPAPSYLRVPGTVDRSADAGQIQQLAIPQTALLPMPTPVQPRTVTPILTPALTPLATIGLTEEIVPLAALPVLPAPLSTPLLVQDDNAEQAVDQVPPRRTKARKNRQYKNDKAQRNALARGTSTKTRQEVIAELMRAKRDGSYRAASEIYR
ncbi:MAG: hypothetical protein V4695_07015 [Pseudomonadota bacterium]